MLILRRCGLVFGLGFFLHNLMLDHIQEAIDLNITVADALRCATWHRIISLPGRDFVHIHSLDDRLEFHFSSPFDHRVKRIR